jgi:hypothetical protein
MIRIRIRNRIGNSGFTDPDPLPDAVDLHQAMAGKEMKLEQTQMPRIISIALLRQASFLTVYINNCTMKGTFHDFFFKETFLCREQSCAWREINWGRSKVISSLEKL